LVQEDKEINYLNKGKLLYLITYRDNQFYIEIKTESLIDHDDYQSEVDYLKWLYIAFNDTSKRWKISEDRIQEIILWFERDRKKYEISSLCAEKFIEMQNQYKREVEFYRNRVFDKSILKENVIPFNYQITAIEKRLSLSRFLDSFDAGLGKTFINICVFSQLYKENKIDGIIIIVPIGLSFHWVRQILQFVSIFNENDIQIINNEEKIKPFNRYVDKKILIIRQDLIADCIASYKKDYDSKKSLKNIRWNDYVDIKKEWNKENLLLLIDESHSIKHTSSIKTKAIFSIKKYFDKICLLTATPFINGAEDSYSQFKLLDNSIIPMEENAFKLWIAQSIGNKWDRYAINIYNSDNVKKLMQSYQHIFFQARKEDIEEVKTKKIIKPIELQLTTNQKILYQKIVEKELYILQEEYDMVTWKLLLNRIHLLLEIFDNAELLKKRSYSDSEINKLIDSCKLDNDPKFIYLKNRVEDICGGQEKKIIIFDIHPSTLDELYIKFKKYNPLIIHGQTKCLDKDKDRQEKQDLFNYDKNYRMILLSLYTSSAGINLQYGGSNIIINTLAWDATLFRQAQDRIYRVDSKYDSLIELPYYPLSLDNLRMKRNFNRIEFNSKLDQEISQDELDRLLNGTY
jgi:hypothetical protein